LDFGRFESLAACLRNEDRRLLTGRALFVDDIAFPDMVHAAFLRSAVAHGRIRNIDVEAARARPGVVAVYTAADLGSPGRCWCRRRSPD